MISFRVISRVAFEVEHELQSGVFQLSSLRWWLPVQIDLRRWRLDLFFGSDRGLLAGDEASRGRCNPRGATFSASTYGLNVMYIHATPIERRPSHLLAANKNQWNVIIITFIQEISRKR